jgi:hypothetical protein
LGFCSLCKIYIKFIIILVVTYINSWQEIIFSVTEFSPRNLVKYLNFH